ncbi:High-osmolarity-induced transcription protein 1 [Purpureocillium lavendulum]|uniref:High-osmolarity-induced transcription protein 1 n=1 Tax=Purpureocillium lavendulum TaxID=1247861 RepID=A0AB34FBM7_9HYPO|nr:High-osmolarity-induced transcription protein 1 [Purpureocillium lavendulum]
MIGGSRVDIAPSAIAEVDQGRVGHLALLVLGAIPEALVHEGTKDPPAIPDKMDGTDERATMGVMAGMGVPETTDGTVEMAARDRMALVAHPVPRVLEENRDVKVTLVSPECKVPRVLKGHQASKALLEIGVWEGHRGRNAGAIDFGQSN